LGFLLSFDRYIDGVSPNDLIPTVGLRKAAEMFITGVMEQVDEIEQQQVEETENTVDDTAENNLARRISWTAKVLKRECYCFKTHVSFES